MRRWMGVWMVRFDVLGKRERREKGNAVVVVWRERVRVFTLRDRQGGCLPWYLLW